MSLTIGRVGIDVALDDPQTWEQSGDDIHLSGWLSAATAADAKTLRQQLSGYVNNADETVIPVTWDQDTTVNGFYRLLDVTVTTVEASLVAGWFPFNLRLQRVQDSSGPRFETVSAGATRANDYTDTESAWISLPPGVTEVSDVGTSEKFRAVAETGVDFVAKLILASYSSDVLYTADPAKTYTGAASLLVTPAGTSFAQNPAAALTAARYVVGRQIPILPAAGWMLSNGLIRVWPTTNGFYLQWFKPSGTGSPAWMGDATTATNGRLVKVDIGGAFFDLTVGQPVVLRNSPVEVVIRLPVSAARKARGAGTIGFAAVLDVSLRRAARSVGFTLTTNDTGTVTVAGSPNEAATVTSGYSQATATDANGGRLTVGMAKTATLGTATESAARTIAANVPLAFMAAFWVGASDGSPWNEWMAAVGETVLVVGR